MNILSVGVEYYAIANVFNTVPTLRHPPTLSTPTPTTTSTSSSETTTTTPFLSTLQSLLPALTFYLTHPAFLPSISLSLLYFTVLSFGGNMVAYLLSAHYSSTNVGIIRTVAVIFEISATWIAPGVMSRMGPVRAGMWFLSWQMIWLTGGVVGFLRGGGGKNDDGDDGGFLAASWLVVGVVASRVGLWGFDLCAQIIIQEEVSPPTRGTFSSIESSFQNTFELASFAATMVFSRPDQFRYPVLMSCGAIYVAGALYAAFVRRRRGHLLHFSKCVGEVKGKKRGDDGVERPLLAGLVEGDGGREGGRGREEV
ncbi:hypothetical protein FQN53_009766 [Emmonsiellopsis sp. PD_33]|nr:hypothetical protein FQN53_009766 [Emmonsiellopsis sp. PD_33]